MNVLITSISRKVPLIQAVRTACDQSFSSYKLFGADANPAVIGRYFVDVFWQMPLLKQLAIEEFIRFCLQHEIKAVIPTRDGELIFFAHYKQELLKHGIHVMVSSLDSVKLCLDKLSFYEQARHYDLPVIPTFQRLEALSGNAIVVKERYGAGADRIGLNLNCHEAERHASKLEHPIYQPFIKGEEYSIDLYVDLAGKVKGVIPRKRVLVIDGESQVTRTVMNESLIQLGKRFLQYFSFYGHIVLQVLVDADGKIHIIECNPRFGGASTLSIASGLDSFRWFFREVAGENLDDVPFIQPQEEKKMIRFPQDRFIV